LALLLLVATAAAQDAPGRLEARLDRRSIYFGEEVTLSVVLHDAESAADPELAGFDEFDVTPAGTSSQSRFAGGRIYRQFVYRFSLRPKRSGRVEVPVVTLSFPGGKVLKTEPLTLKVIPPTSQDHVIVQVRAEPASVYPLQSFTVRLRIFVEKLPEGYRELDPVSQLSNVGLQVPWVDVPEGLESGDYREWLTPRMMQRRRGGFSINGLTAGGASLFSDPRTALFDLDGREATEKDVADFDRPRGKHDDYFVYTLEREFTPMRVGRYDLGAVILKGTFAARIENRRFIPREIFTASNPLTVEVKQVPQAGKPAAFTGGVGEFEMEAAVAPRQVHVGDPMTLTLRVKGRGSIEDIAPPPLTGFEESFKVYEATAAMEDGERVFTWSIRPAHAEVREVPPISLAYFDFQRERYVTIATKPIPIEVREASRLDTDEIDARRLPADSDLEARTEGLFADITDAREVRDETVPVEGYLLCFAGLAGLYVGMSLGIRRRRRLNADPALVRRRGAVARARERSAEDPVTVFGGLVADLQNIPEAGLTAAETVRRMRELGVGGALGDRVEAYLLEAEGRRYGAGGSGGAVDAGLLEEVIGALR
jgi:hypothetical protein